MVAGSCVLRETILKGRPWLVREFLYLWIDRYWDRDRDGSK